MFRDQGFCCHPRSHADVRVQIKKAEPSIAAVLLYELRLPPTALAMWFESLGYPFVEQLRRRRPTSRKRSSPLKPQAVGRP